MSFLGGLYTDLVKEPIFNLIQLFYNMTGDTGWAIVLIAVLLNLAMFPLFVKSYINSQKTKLLQPEIKKIQEKYKATPQELYKKTQELYTKHGIKNSSTFLVLILQILILTGLYFIIQNVVNGNTDKLPQLYSFIKGETFGRTAFNYFDISKFPSEYGYILPLATAIMTYFQGMYTFKWGPKPQISPEVRNKKEEAGFAASLQKSMQFPSLYVLPVLFFFINMSLSTGVNIYFFTSTAIGLIRQVILAYFYSKHTNILLEEIADSDPLSKDNNPNNNIDILPNADQTADLPQVTNTAKTVNFKKKKKHGKK